MMSRITIVGAGNLAWAFAGDLSLRFGKSCRVTVWAAPAHRTDFDRVAAMGHLELTGAISGKFFPTLERDLSKAVALADFILVAVPTFGQVDVLNAMAPFDLGASIVIVLPGSGFTLAARRILRPELSPKVILETTTSPYACRRTENMVSISGLKNQVQIAASQQLDAATKAAIGSLFPKRLEWYRDMASIFFSNVNPVAHPAGILHARETISSGLGPFPPFYTTFVAGSIDLVLAVDDERLSIVRALGLQSDTDFGYSRKWYGADAPDPKTFYQTFEGYADIATPDTIHHRYLKEDVKHIMVVWEEIALVCGIKVPVMESIVNEASAALNENLRETGRNLSKLGLAGAKGQEILRALNGNDLITGRSLSFPTPRKRTQ